MMTLGSSLPSPLGLCPGRLTCSVLCVLHLSLSFSFRCSYPRDCVYFRFSLYTSFVLHSPRFHPVPSTFILTGSDASTWSTSTLTGDLSPPLPSPPLPVDRLLL
eukprot:RCo034235